MPRARCIDCGHTTAGESPCGVCGYPVCFGCRHGAGCMPAGPVGEMRTHVVRERERWEAGMEKVPPQPEENWALKRRAKPVRDDMAERLLWQ